MRKFHQTRRETKLRGGQGKEKRASFVLVSVLQTGKLSASFPESSLEASVTFFNLKEEKKG
jgi:hypothetical protein